MTPEFTSVAELNRHYAGVTARLWPAPQKRRLLRPVPPPQPLPALDEAVVPAFLPRRPPERQRSSLLLAQSRAVRKIILEVAAKHDLSPKDILLPGRFKHLTAARHEACFRMRTEIEVMGSPMSYPRIGKVFGYDHTSVLHGCRKHAALLEREGRSAP